MFSRNCSINLVIKFVGIEFFCVLTSLVDPRRVDDFSVHSAFSLFAWDSDFQASCMWIENWQFLDMLYSFLFVLCSVKLRLYWMPDFLAHLSYTCYPSISKIFGLMFQIFANLFMTALPGQAFSYWVLAERCISIANWNIAHCMAGVIILLI